MPFRSSGESSLRVCSDVLADEKARAQPVEPGAAATGIGPLDFRNDGAGDGLDGGCGARLGCVERLGDLAGAEVKRGGRIAGGEQPAGNAQREGREATPDEFLPIASAHA